MKNRAKTDTIQTTKWAPLVNLATGMEHRAVEQLHKPRRHMPTDGHTHKQTTAPTLTTSIAREILSDLMGRLFDLWK